MALAQISQSFLVAWLGALAAIVLYRILRGEIKCSGLLAANTGETVSVERVQLLIASIIAIGGYSLETLSKAENAAGSLNSLPDVPIELIVLLGGSQTLYLAAKFARASK